MKKKYNLMKKRHSLAGLLFVSPFAFGIIFFYLAPIVQSFLYSFGDLDPSNSYKLTFNGLIHYHRAFFVDAQFVRILLPNVLSTLAKIPIIIIFSFLIATMLKNSFRGRNVFRMIMFLPVVMCAGIIPMLDAADLMQGMISGGGIQEGTGQVLANIEPIKEFLLGLNLNAAFVSYILSAVTGIFSVINNSGVQMLIFLAALQSVPSSLNEASSIEGATAWEHFWKITFPMVSPQILVCVIYTTIDSFTNLTNSVMQYISNLINKRFEFGYGMSLSWIYFFIVIAALLVLGGTVSKFVVYSEK